MLCKPRNKVFVKIKRETSTTRRTKNYCFFPVYISSCFLKSVSYSLKAQPLAMSSRHDDLRHSRVKKLFIEDSSKMKYKIWDSSSAYICAEYSHEVKRNWRRRERENECTYGAILLLHYLFTLSHYTKHQQQQPQKARNICELSTTSPARSNAYSNSNFSQFVQFEILIYPRDLNK